MGPLRPASVPAGGDAITPPGTDVRRNGPTDAAQRPKPPNHTDNPPLAALLAVNGDSPGYSAGSAPLAVGDPPSGDFPGSQATLTAPAAATIRPISSSNPIPAASAAWGSRLVSVRPGIASASST